MIFRKSLVVHISNDLPWFTKLLQSFTTEVDALPCPPDTIV